MDLFDRFSRFLFDFSAAQENRQEVADILEATLTISRSDTDFLPTLRLVLNDWEGTPERGKYRFHTFLRFMGQYRRTGDSGGDWHLRARHLLEDLPTIYGATPPSKKGAG